MKYLFLLLSLFCTHVFAQDQKAQEIINIVSQKINSSPSYYYEYRAKVSASHGAILYTNGHIYNKGNKYYSTAGDVIKINNGQYLYTIIKDEKTVYRTSNDLSNEKQLPFHLINDIKNSYRNIYNGTEYIGGQQSHVIDSRPKTSSSSSISSIRTYVSSVDNSVKMMTIKFRNGDKIDYTIVKFANMDIHDSKFNFDKSKFPGYLILLD